MANTIQLKRRLTGAAGAPSALKSGEVAYNQVDDILYIGAGDDGSGNATNIIPLAGNGHFATNAQISGLSFGDMTKAVYDPNDDGKVTAAVNADVAPYSGLTGVPSEFAPADHDAAKITTGVIDAARLPATAFQAPIVSSGGLGDLTIAQQNVIGEGTTVTTTDGVMYQFTGVGDPTSAAAYVELADRTPDWSQVAGKPATFPSASHTHVLADITDAGSMASQAASAVAITGGTIDNVILDGGTF